MEKLTFKRQIVLGITLIIAGNILAFVFHKGIFSSIAWIIYGLLFFIDCACLFSKRNTDITSNIEKA